MLLKKEKLPELLAALSAQADVYTPAPAGKDGKQKFELYEVGSMPEFGGAKTEISPKELLFPQTETIYSYSKMGEDVTIVEAVNEVNQILFGVRSCDAYSIERLDEVFLTRSYVDTLYYKRRINTFIVALGCTSPDRSCFCTSFGIDPALAQGADMQLSDAGDSYYLEALTEVGAQALELWQPFLEPGEKPAPVALDFSLVVDTKNVKESLEQMFEDPYWFDLSLRCLNCGTCAFVCPTCHCFDMSQSNKGNSGHRFRTWDACTFTDYSMMAGNHNPRPTKMERLRQRFMHKLSFFDDRYGSSMCCGCGRCIEMCPVGIDISRVIEDTQETKEVAIND